MAVSLRSTRGAAKFRFSGRLPSARCYDSHVPTNTSSDTFWQVRSARSDQLPASPSHPWLLFAEKPARTSATNFPGTHHGAGQPDGGDNRGPGSDLAIHFRGGDTGSAAHAMAG